MGELWLEAEIARDVRDPLDDELGVVLLVFLGYLLQSAVKGLGISGLLEVHREHGHGMSTKQSKSYVAARCWIIDAGQDGLARLAAELAGGVADCPHLISIVCCCRRL